MNTTTSVLIQSMMKIAGAWLATKGFNEASRLEEASGFVTALVGFIWHLAHSKTLAGTAPDSKQQSLPLRSVALALGLFFGLMVFSGCGSIPLGHSGAAVGFLGTNRIGMTLYQTVTTNGATNCNTKSYALKLPFNPGAALNLFMTAEGVP